MDGSYYRDLIRPVFSGRRWLLAADVLQGATGRAAELHDLGAGRSFVLAAARGTGDPPAEEHATHHVLGTSGHTIMEAMRSAHAALIDPPAEVRAAIDGWDPERTARAIHGLTRAGRLVAGRAVYGGRQREWAELEDKMVIDAVWDAAGVPRAPSEIVPATPDALRAAAGRLDRGIGTAWVADNREGWHGGAEYLRWVQTDADAAAAVAFFAAHADRVRVMPFLEGVPCSIHGMVFPDLVATFNPVEMVILRVAGQRALRYGGSSTWWDAPPAAATEMRAVARRVGAWLQQSVGYRAGFSVDGVLTAEGFRPTELNPRHSIGLAMQLAAVEGMPDLLQFPLMEGEDLDYRPVDLERLAREASAVKRGGGAHHVVSVVRTETEEVAIRFVDGRAERAGDEAEPDAWLSFGPGSLGGWVRLRPNPDTTPVGTWMAPRAAAAFALADTLWNTNIGPLTPSNPA